MHACTYTTMHAVRVHQLKLRPIGPRGLRIDSVARIDAYGCEHATGSCKQPRAATIGTLGSDGVVGLDTVARIDGHELARQLHPDDVGVGQALHSQVR